MSSVLHSDSETGASGLLGRATNLATAAIAGLALMTVAVVIEASPATAQVGGAEISGTVYWDEDQDGQRDDDELGLAGVVVRAGSGDAIDVTDANGTYLLRGVEAGTPFHVQTGWFRTQCDGRWCDPGPGPDNNVAVNTQRVRTDDVGDLIDEDDRAEVNVGLVPAWNDVYPVPEDLEPAEHDVAVRLTKTGGCEVGTREENLCAPGETISAQLEILNQGTAAIDGVDLLLRLPQDTEIRTPPTPAEGYNFDPDLSVEAGRTDSAARSTEYSITGEIPPGGVGFFWVALDTTPGPGSPTPTPVERPYDRQAHVRITSLSPAPDVDSTPCLGLNASDCVQAVGPDNKLRGPDTSDAMGWNVSAEPTPADRSARLRLRSTSGDLYTPGDDLDLVVDVANTGTVDGDLSNLRIQLSAPAGTSLPLEANPGWSVVDGRAQALVPGPLAMGATARLPVTISHSSGTDPCESGPLRLGVELLDADSADVDADGILLPALDPGQGELLAEPAELMLEVGSECSTGGPSILDRVIPILIALASLAVVAGVSRFVWIEATRRY